MGGKEEEAQKEIKGHPRAWEEEWAQEEARQGEEK